MPDPAPAPSPAPAAAAAKRQRVVMTVPTPDSKFVLGSRDFGNIGYAGITGHTVEHVMFRALGDESTATIEAKQQVTLHSTDSTLTAFAGSDMLLAAVGSAYVAAKKDVFITAGAGSPTLAGIDYANAAPVPDDPQGKITAQQESAAKVIETMATVIGGIETSVGVLMALLAADTTKKSLAILAVQTVAKVISMVVKEAKELEGEIHTYSQGSTSLSSLKEVTMSGVQGVGMSSPTYASVVGGIEAGMTGLISASVTAGSLLGLTGGVEASLLGGHKTSIAARRGELEFNGKIITVGAAKPAFPQAATTNVDITATTSISSSIVSTAGTPTSCELNDSGAVLKGKSVNLVGTNTVGHTVGPNSVSLTSSGAAMVYSFKSAADQAIETANTTFSTAKTAAEATYKTSRDAALALAGSAALTALVAAHTTKQAALKAAQTALDTSLAAAQTLAAAVLRVGVSASEAEVTNGISKITVDKAGNITIDAGAMSVTLKSGASSIEMTPASIKMSSPSITQG